MPLVNFNCTFCGKKHIRFIDPCRMKSNKFCGPKCQASFYNGRKEFLKEGEERIMKDSYGKDRCYVYLPHHPKNMNGGWVSRSRVVMEKKLGRLLLSSDIVHHINRNTLDDRVENLRVFANKTDHSKVHSAEKGFGETYLCSESKEWLEFLYIIFGTNKQKILGWESQEGWYLGKDVINHGYNAETK